MKTIIFPVLMVIGWLICLPEASAKKKPTVDFSPVEMSVLQILREIQDTEDDSLAIQHHFRIEDILAETFIQPEAYLYPFDSLKNIGMLYAPRNKFRLINWNHAFQDGTHRYFALLVFPSIFPPNNVIRLIDLSDAIENPESKTLDANGWYGALYYRIVPGKKINDTYYYTLLGSDMNNADTKKKIIDVLVLEEDGTVTFGADIFELNKKFKHRLIFEFASESNMYLDYNSFKRRIEFDHLAPSMPYLVGSYEYYEPDMFRDGLKFKSHHWKHYKDIVLPPHTKKVKNASSSKATSKTAF
jgi:hypothetical protein